MQQPDHLIDYIEKAKLGDEDAFAIIFKETHSMVYNIACAAVKNPEEAKDVVSEVYIRVFRYLPTLRDSHSFIRWLTVITHNVCTDHLANAENTSCSPPVPEPPGEDDIELWHQKEAIQSVIQRIMLLLPEPQQRAVNYVYFHQLSVGQAAALENCSANTIKSRLFYARTTLRRAIEEEERRTGDKLHLPPAVLGIAALMALPGIPVTLSAAESAKIFTTILSALSIGQTVNPESVTFIAVPEEDEASPKRNKLRSALQRKYLLKFSPAAIIPFVLILLVLMTTMLGIGYLQHTDPPPSDGSNPAADAQTTETTPVLENVSPFTYSVGEDGIILEKIVTDEPSLDIPAEIDGLPVVALAEDAFGKGLYIERLSLPATLKTVSGRTLAALKELKIIEVENSSPYLKAVNGVLYSADMTQLIAYPNNKPGSDFVIPSSVTVIGEYAMTSRNLLTISNSYSSFVETLRPYALAGCINLQMLSIPVTLTKVEENALACPSLTSIKTAYGNPCFWTINDALYNHDKTVLIRYPAGKRNTSCTVYPSTTTIAPYAFYGCVYLQELTLKTNVTTLEENALAGMPALRSIRLSDRIQSLPAGALADNPQITEYMLPSSLKEFDATAFSGCPALERLTFRGPCPTMVGGDKLELADEDTVLLYPAAQESWANADKFGVINTGTYTTANQISTP